MSSTIRTHGNMSLNANQAAKLSKIHGILMAKGFPYHSVSVVFRPNDGFCCHFADSVRDKVTSEVIDILKEEGFNYLINPASV